jgi:hypothetical protein
MQDKSINAVNSFINNWKLIIGLIYISVYYLGSIIVGIILSILILIEMINYFMRKCNYKISNN